MSPAPVSTIQRAAPKAMSSGAVSVTQLTGHAVADVLTHVQRPARVGWTTLPSRADSCRSMPAIDAQSDGQMTVR
jgi:hypothetical protein